MALSIDWKTKIITVPRADLQIVQTTPTEIRQLNINLFWAELKDIEDGEGMPYTDIQSRNAAIAVGGVTLAPVVQILEPYTITFEDSQYAVNLVGANSNIGDRVNVNQVSVRSANSAGLTFSEEINAQSFLGASVYINPALGVSGTNYPSGTPTSQVNNYTDAKAIAVARNFDSFNLDGSLVFDVADDTARTLWVGKSPILADVTFNGNDITGSEFKNMGITGDMSGFCAIRDCRISDVTGFCGTMRDCLIQGNITVDPACTGPLVISGSSSGVPGSARPVLDMNEADADFQLRDYSGGFTFEGMTQDRSVSMDINSGTVEIGATCTSGTIVVRGVCTLIDNSGPGCIVITDGHLEPKHLAEMHRLQGLDASNPMTVTPTTRVAGDITQAITGDGETTSTVTRQ